MRKAGHFTSFLAAIGSIGLVSCDRADETGSGETHSPRVIDADLAFVDVSVVPMTREIVLEGYSALVRDGVIVAVAPSDQISPSADALVVMGNGRYLIPGLSDMHSHLQVEAFPKYVASGVTLVRNMWGSPEVLEFRRRIEAGEIVGPRIVTAGPIVDGDPPVVPTMIVVVEPAAARAAMDEQKAAGYDFLKIYDGVSREVFDAVAAYSKEIDFPFAGHVPIDVPLDVATRSGMVSIEHLMEWDRATAVAGSPLEEALKTRVWTEQLRNMAVLSRQVATGALSTEQLFDADRRRAMALLAAETGVWNVPTVNLPRQALPSRRQVAVQQTRLEMRFVAPADLDLWSDPTWDPRFVGLSDEDREALQVFLFDEYLRRVKALHDAGAGLLIGSDSPNPFVLYGVAVHQELAFFVEAGLRPYDALVAATRAPAEFLNDESFGTIEEGKFADLVLLDANPLADIGATRAIAGVSLHGRWLPRAELDAMLEAIAAGYATSTD